MRHGTCGTGDGANGEGEKEDWAVTVLMGHSKIGILSV